MPFLEAAKEKFRYGYNVVFLEAKRENFLLGLWCRVFPRGRGRQMLVKLQCRAFFVIEMLVRVMVLCLFYMPRRRNLVMVIMSFFQKLRKINFCQGYVVLSFPETAEEKCQLSYSVVFFSKQKCQLGVWFCAFFRSREGEIWLWLQCHFFRNKKR